MDTLNRVKDRFGVTWGKRTPAPVEIPNAGREELATFLGECGFRTGVEIGVMNGEYSELLCQRIPGLKLYSVDPWNVVRWSGAEQEARARERLSKYPGCTILKATSADAALLFKGRSIDFVYIDGDHRFNAVANDLWLWTQRVRRGGIVAGHDFTYFRGGMQRAAVPEAATAFVRAFQIHPWFVLGRKAILPGEVRDKQRSFFFVR